jgi:hypothetical protein
MEHSGEEPNVRRLVGIALLEGKNQFERSIFEGSVSWPKNHRVPHHDVLWARRAADSGRRVRGEVLEITNETATARGTLNIQKERKRKHVSHCSRICC